MGIPSPYVTTEPSEKPESSPNPTSSQTSAESQPSQDYYQSRNWPDRAQRFLENAKVPNLHAHRVPDPEADPRWFQHVNEARNLLGRGFLYCFNGKRGTGKTQAAVSVGKQACLLAARRNEQNRRPFFYATAMDFFLSIKATYGTDDKCERDAIAPYLNCSLLVLDEIQVRGSTEWEDRMLDHVIDKRYGMDLDTILIANLTDSDLAKNLGPSIVSRLTEKGRVCTFTNPSFRAMNP